MYYRNQTNFNPTQGGRIQWGSFGFIAGIVIGIMLGWMFSGLIGAFVRLALVAMVVIPLILLYIAWRKFFAPARPQQYPSQFGGALDRDYGDPFSAIETRGVVRGQVHEPRVR